MDAEFSATLNHMQAAPDQFRIRDKLRYSCKFLQETEEISRIQFIYDRANHRGKSGFIRQNSLSFLVLSRKPRPINRRSAGNAIRHSFRDCMGQKVVDDDKWKRLRI